MKHRKKSIWKLLFTSLPFMALLACGNMQKEDGLKVLLAEQQSTVIEEDLSREKDQNVSEGKKAAQGTEIDKMSTAFVHICGEVENPGVYEVSMDSRVCDVLNLAGGFTNRAAKSAINLAELVTDGMMVVVPSEEELREQSLQIQRQEAGMVNINTATADELGTLPGIGKSRAEAIIAYRQEYGDFSAIEDIMQVSGIKSGMFEDLKDKIYVDK